MAAFLKSALFFLAETALIIATATLSFRRGQILSTHIPKPFELLLLIALLLTLIHLWLNNFSIKPRTISLIKISAAPLLLFIVFMVMAMTWSYFNWHASPNSARLTEFLRYVTAIATFFIFLFYAAEDKKFINKVLYAFAFQIIYAILLFWPALVRNFSLAMDNRLNGFADDPNYFGNLLLIPYIIFLTFALMEKKFWKKLLAIFASILMATLLFWTSSRGTWAALILSSFFIWALYILKFLPKIKERLITLAMIGLIFAGGIILLPSNAKFRAIYKIFPHARIEYQNNAPVSVSSSELGSADVFSGQDRGSSWLHYSKIILTNPLGIGPMYWTVPSVGFEKPFPLASHNIILETILVSGFGGFICLIILFKKISANLLVELKKSALPAQLFRGKSWAGKPVIPIILAGGLFAVFISDLFLDSLNLRWFWIIAALALAYLADNNS